MKLKILLTCLLISNACAFVYSQSLYFPPVSGNNWDTISPLTLGWCPDKIDTLTQYLEDKNTKAFIVLKDGKIVIEHYYGTFTQDSIWYWASAGKSLAAFLTGIAQEEGLLNITDTVSNYLASGWTSCASGDEEKITIFNQLTMTSGLDDDVPDPDCTDDTCLICIDTPGNRWVYHNAPYHLLHDVLEVASGNTLNFYTYSKLALQTGITGAWVDHIFFSKPRAMARFGLLTLANGIWSNDTILHDANYLQQMTNTSQPMNPSYGYLWWLNGKGSYMAPQSQFVFQTDLVPNAPDDMFAALGKNDQKIYIVPSQNLVVVRMGDNSGNIPVLAISSFDNELWGKLNDVFCGTLSIASDAINNAITIYPNPSGGNFFIDGIHPEQPVRIALFDHMGRKIFESLSNEKTIATGHLGNGIYSAFITEGGKYYPVRNKVVIIH